MGETFYLGQGVSHMAGQDRKEGDSESRWMIGVPTSRERYRRVQAEAQRRGLSMAALVRLIIDQWLEAREKEDR